MFDVSRPFLFFDYFRVPHTLRRGGSDDGAFGTIRLSGASDGRVLRWAVPEELPDALPLGAYDLGSFCVYCRVVTNDTVSSLLPSTGSWRPETPVRDSAGEVVSAVWRGANGEVVLPFDPGEAIQNLWSERYRAAVVGGTSRLTKRAALRSYYRLRPLLPRSTQIALRRAFARVQVRTVFPRWPIEPALHDLYDLLFSLVAELAEEPVPWIAPWPDGREWAFVLTHDVETADGLSNLDALRAPEVAAGYRSSWNLVPRRYSVPDVTIDELAADGFEIGVHGLYHDGRDLESRSTLDARIPEMRAAGRRWGAVGFRSPATHRVWDWMPLLGFDYDSSYPDTDPFEPQAGGCCSLLPYFNDDLVELPITLPQDHTVFVILRHPDEAVWIDKASFIKRRGGMALLITHPDYFTDGRLVGNYQRFLEHFADDATMWRALPREVSAWWRRRAASTVEPAGSSWRVVGPASGEARIVLTGRT